MTRHIVPMGLALETFDLGQTGLDDPRWSEPFQQDELVLVPTGSLDLVPIVPIDGCREIRRDVGRRVCPRQSTFLPLAPVFLA
ncbi:MAG: hypothetical protein NTNFB02_15950 [Nitrospira sp.]